MSCIIHKCLIATQFNLKEKEWSVTSYRASVWSWGISRRGWHPTIFLLRTRGLWKHTLCAAASRPKDLLTSCCRQTTLPFTGRETGMFSWDGWGSLLKHMWKSQVHLFHWSMITHLGKPPSLCWVQGKPWNQQHCKSSTTQMGIPTWSTDRSCVPTANVSISVHCVHSYSTHTHTHTPHTQLSAHEAIKHTHP